MKHILLLLLAALSLQASIAQQPQPVFMSNPFPKTITVSGSAEMEVVPDEIYVNIELREYQKKGEPKTELETIKTKFMEACKTAGIPDSAISIAAYTGSNNYYYIKKNKKPADLFAGITYQVKFKNSLLMDKLVEQLDDNATQNFSIVSASHSQITEFRKQLKIKAVQAAKAKGIYLTEAIGEKLGEAITIDEPSEPQLLSRGSNTSYNIRLPDNYKDLDGVEFKKIKLRFEVSVVFALK